MKKILISVGAILVVGLVAAGSFWGGMTYQSNQVNQAQINFENSRGPANGGQMPANGGQMPTNGQAPNSAPNAGFMGGGTTGQVKTIEGDVMTLSTAMDVTTVNLSDSTQVEISETVTVADLQPGMQVTVTGQRDSNGELSASRVMILNDDTSRATGVLPPPEPTAVGTEP